MAKNLETRPSVPDLEGDNRWVALAQKHWLKQSKIRKVKQDVIKKEIWDPLEAEGFTTRSLLTLENLNILEKYLWPTYTDDASNHHVLLIAVIVGIKKGEHLPIWEHFADRPDSFSNLFHRILSLSLDVSLSTFSRLSVLSFIICSFQSLENTLIRKECAPLVSISIWHNLSSETARNQTLEKTPMLKKAWRAAAKRYEAADESMKAKIRFERAWLYTLILDFLQRVSTAGQAQADNIRYCERFLELLVDLNSQLPTRRYVNTLLQDLNILAVIRLSELYDSPNNSLIRDFFTLLHHFMNFAIDDYSGEPLSIQTTYDIHCQRLARLQRTAIKHFKDKLTILALSNYGSLEQRSELEGSLSVLNDAELEDLCARLGFRTTYPKQSQVMAHRQLYLEILVSYFEKKPSFQEAATKLSTVPTDESLYEPALLRNETYDGSRPLAIPKLNLQYLSLGDFLWRSFMLYRAEAFFSVRKDIEAVMKRLQPRINKSTREVVFDGFTKMAIPISKPAIIEVAQPRVGSTNPAFVRAEITLEVGRLADNIRKEWESLRPDDTVFLLAITPPPASTALNLTDKPSLTYVRTADVVQVLDENGRVLREPQNQSENGFTRRPQIRRLLLNLDAAAFQTDQDKQSQGKREVYPLINVIVRRKGRENNFKSVLQTMQQLITSAVALPSWLQEIFLGYGDPASARYTELPNRAKSIDFRDTFLDWQHLVESFPGKTIEPSGKESSSFGPPYVLETVDEQPQDQSAGNASKKRRRGQVETQAESASIHVSTYKPPNPGPYPVDAPKLNTIRFTPAQVEAIASGTQPGLTVIVGPPGTGKTDVVTQIINNIYHNFPSERTLLIAHSNQALNQLFQKIVSLDIDQRHLLRLGHGEEELGTETSYSKYGRVESFLENRTHLLAEVDRLAASIGALGAHGNSCETAEYFNTVYIQPAWTKFWDKARSESASVEDIAVSFPFHSYFSNAPNPLFTPGSSKDNVLDAAAGAQRHIDKIFSELADIRPFEILRQPRDRANYLLIKEARIIAMTSTHAAMRRQEIADLGFHYDNVVMEEAAQITEIETFIPLALQNMEDGHLLLKRVVLCGDHYQNSPIVQNLAFRQYANFEQSLFLRLVRLGVPTVTLDQQGRARPSIADLFKWRYKTLGHLPQLEEDPEYSQGNAGFACDYQFINVDDYQGTGEREPAPHFIQNLGEAEYAVAIYQYMRLLGYPASKITILTAYAGQKALIRDILSHRCAKIPIFGMPRIVTTIDQYQGEQNDYVILSLVRTRTVGYLRDVRRLTVALSRARLGLYILGRLDVFASCYELKPAFDLLAKRSNKLMLIPGEMYPTKRLQADDVEGTPMENVEHMGQYVFEMTQAKLKAMGSEGLTVPDGFPDGDDIEEVDGDEIMVGGADDDEDLTVQQHV
ncbi:DEAD helicases superfamily protein (Aquarius), putative [Talaromyces stipitatus ATCC 10500]|uniref:Pre-mRNA-splicing factor n=1 Tax=Talaromyces stipitatus (strain ATCC 10500 / CBS 375.48 / QM 6759 / NRRL 1006) TaxID=441959 RepID=B8MDV1_TALSN|nr:DEAD helicases superfamily protein (Aquarius), putative [Talaromyces stipitatus ATCC 10500]EED18330.1 DEAD helicases superfamily protein (Aquarius), putative [Talaromyces stipitatus ATCC 10500]